MRRLLILHCGPMKTGSTAIQDALKFHRKTLLQLEIDFYHIRAKALQQDLEQILSGVMSRDCRVVLLSSEFFCQMNPISLKRALRSFDGECHAVLISRPLREIYPSLFLQNLKGSSRRVTSFEYFLDRQIELDLTYPNNRDGIGGQLMNFPVLDARLSDAGCLTHWIRYDRDSLILDFFQTVEKITGIPIKDMSDVIL